MALIHSFYHDFVFPHYHPFEERNPPRAEGNCVTSALIFSSTCTAPIGHSFYFTCYPGSFSLTRYPPETIYDHLRGMILSRVYSLLSSPLLLSETF